MRPVRYAVPGSPVFITQVTACREPLFADPANVALLRATMRETRTRCPFQMRAFVFLPDHFHILIEPALSTTFSSIMMNIKSNFSRQLRVRLGASAPLILWQKSFWDHVIRDQLDLNNHVDYIHFNPVHHGYVPSPAEWADSSFAEWQRRGYYPVDWQPVDSLTALLADDSDVARVMQNANTVRRQVEALRMPGTAAFTAATRHVRPG